MSPGTSVVAERQRPLRTRYTNDPAEAITTKRVRSVHAAACDPFHGAVEAVGEYPPTRWEFGQDDKVGGYDDLPNTGHLLCAALAACQDNVIRMIADHLGITISHLDVEVTGQVDCRGCLNIDDQVRVGFFGMDVQVTLEVAPDTGDALVEVMRQLAERLCVNLDTLRRGVPVTVSFRQRSVAR
jgi:uncharacterized OsmC-like protein